MIRFETIRWKNLLSTGNAFTEINFTKARTSLILGENGAGKSTLLDALCFALFGRAYRDVNKPQLLNSVNGKKCEVEVTFTVGSKHYRIVRGIKPTVFEIYVDGELANQDAASRDYQKYLEESVLKLDFKSFTQIVILGSAGFTPFMQLPAASRRAIIEDILDIQIFTIMNGILKSRVKETADEHVQMGRDLDLVKQKALVQEQFIKSLKEDKQAQIDEALDEIEKSEEKKQKLVTMKEALELQIDQLEVSVDEHRGWEAKKALQVTEKMATEREIRRLHTAIQTFKSSSTCPTCGQEIDTSDQEKHLEEQKQTLKAADVALAKILTTIKKYDKHIADLEPAVGEYEIKTDERDSVHNEIRMADNLIGVHTKRVRDLQAKKGNIEEETSKLKALAKDMIVLNKKRTEVGETKYYLDLVATLLKDSGIKTRIINQYLPVINKLVNKYLAEMDFFVQFTLDDEFKEVIKSRFRDEFTYASFSEGEKQRIDLALLFTWRTVAKMKNSASTNLLILDEVFDSSLDANATDYVLGLLNTLSTDSHVFVISHKPEALADKFERTLRFEKRQNFSVLLEDI